MYSSSWHRFSSTETQIKPLQCRTMKATLSVVAFSAAMIKSPSFSRFSSSYRFANVYVYEQVKSQDKTATKTMTNFPSRMSSNALSIVENGGEQRAMPSASCWPSFSSSGACYVTPSRPFNCPQSFSIIGGIFI